MQQPFLLDFFFFSNSLFPRILEEWAHQKALKTNSLSCLKSTFLCFKFLDLVSFIPQFNRCLLGIYYPVGIYIYSFQIVFCFKVDCCLWGRADRLRPWDNFATQGRGWMAQWKEPSHKKSTSPARTWLEEFFTSLCQCLWSLVDWQTFEKTPRGWGESPLSQRSYWKIGKEVACRQF